MTKLRNAALAVQAVAWLLRARRLHSRTPAAEIVRRLRGARPPARRSLSAQEAERLRWALLAAARRVPWRSDCLVQSIAARMWLDSLGVANAFHLGMQRTPEGLLAHAWIEVEGRIVTGGRAVGALTEFAPPER